MIFINIPIKKIIIKIKKFLTHFGYFHFFLKIKKNQLYQKNVKLYCEHNHEQKKDDIKDIIEIEKKPINP